ncbi:hypothetical protein SEPCBS57363_006067 [Sporothrix epigloea]|uniref:BZIP domain-containing protein n=1 Tax=Sporothrix epigloea TaxID=1892477 RepID=A0ABP0E1E5_9PEZI
MSMDNAVRSYICDDAGVVHIHIQNQDDGILRPSGTPLQAASRLCAQLSLQVPSAGSAVPPPSLMQAPAQTSEVSIPGAGTLCSLCAHANRLQYPRSSSSKVSTSIRLNKVPPVTMTHPSAPGSNTAAVAGSSRAMADAAGSDAQAPHALFDDGVSEAERKRRRKHNYKLLSENQQRVRERSARRDQYNRQSSLSIRPAQVYDILADVTAPAADTESATGDSNIGEMESDPWQQRFGEPVWTRPPVPFDLRKADPKGKGKEKEGESSA